MDKLKTIYQYWCKISDKIRFLLIGGVNTVISYAIFALAILILGDVHHQACVAIQWILSSFPSYFNQKFFVFCTKGNYVKEYFKCCSTWFVSYFLNTIILELLLRYVIRNVLIAQLISLFIVSIVTYILFKYFAFRKK